jgi:hypothetical protein
MSYEKLTLAAGLVAASQDRPFWTSATTFVRSASENVRVSPGPWTITTPTATLPSR